MPKSPAPPLHIAIVMDGNGRWAKQRGRPRIYGHRRGVQSVKKIIQACEDHQVDCLTLFAFSSENWNRPDQEVAFLMRLFKLTLEREIKEIHKNNIRLKIVGDLSRFDDKLQLIIKNAEALTSGNTALSLNIAANYGGRWDIRQALQSIGDKISSGQLSTRDINDQLIDDHLSLHALPDPDLFIRSGGETRISNFLLWQLAYTELYFSDTLWPDFDELEFAKAIEYFQGRQRRFGKTSEQVENH